MPPWVALWNPRVNFCGWVLQGRKQCHIGLPLQRFGTAAGDGCKRHQIRLESLRVHHGQCPKPLVLADGMRCPLLHSHRWSSWDLVLGHNWGITLVPPNKLPSNSCYSWRLIPIHMVVVTRCDPIPTWPPSPAARTERSCNWRHPGTIWHPAASGRYASGWP